MVFPSIVIELLEGFFIEEDGTGGGGVIDEVLDLVRGLVGGDRWADGDRGEMRQRPFSPRYLLTVGR